MKNIELRDFYAGLAMHAMIIIDYKCKAKEAFKMADKMLTERNKKDDGV